MKTELIVFEKHEDLVRPAEMLARGSVVAFPTETVYGLGANALDPEAVARIFKAKGRPADNPLIVHVADIRDIPPLVREISPLAECLIESFMPGPITLVMKKSTVVPDICSAGLPTVGIRIPGNPIARDLIRTAGVPIAAPSANESGSPSPTRAAHVMKDMDGKIACVIDGGPCEVGLESTVVDVTGKEPVILRPGAVTSEMIARACAEKGFEFAAVRSDTEMTAVDEVPRAPGMKYRHYAPKAPVHIVFPEAEGYTQAFVNALEMRRPDDKAGRIGIFCGSGTRESLSIRLPGGEADRLVFYVYGEDFDVKAAANRLFAGLRSLDKSGVREILAAGFPEGEIGTAYMNRLEKAAAAEARPSREETEPEERTVLFVCTGNTCRSPMAEAIFNVLAERRGPFFDSADPRKKVVPRARSAGIFADFGSPAATYAEDAVHELYGADLSEHRSRKTTNQFMVENRLILTMTAEHACYLREHFPGDKNRVYDLFEYAEKRGVRLPDSETVTYRPGIPDPYGRNLEVYEHTASVLMQIIDALFASIIEDLGATNCLTEDGPVK
jgi:tRNA threonylcarbamoyl adenosine modification protein (Sua5/YciO/YrdC/YwlC family)